MSNEFSFDFDFGHYDRQQLLQDARKELSELKKGMGVSEFPIDQIETLDRTVAELYDNMDGVAELAQASPNVFALNTRFLSDSGLTVPKDFEALSDWANFFWLQVPVLVVNGNKTRFNKIQLGLSFNSGENDSSLLPKAHSMFPDKTFSEILALKGGIDFGIGVDLKFKAAAGVDEVSLPSSIPLVKATAGGKLDINAKVAPSLGFIAGPYSWSIERTVIDASGVGTEKIFWTLSDREMLREKSPMFMVILQVPKEVHHVEVTAALQAYPVVFLPQILIRLLAGLSQRLRDFLDKGGPTRYAKVYNISKFIR